MILRGPCTLKSRTEVVTLEFVLNNLRVRFRDVSVRITDVMCCCDVNLKPMSSSVASFVIKLKLVSNYCDA